MRYNKRQKRKVSQRGNYGLGITLDSVWCQYHGVKAGDTVITYPHKTKSNILVVEIPRNK